MIVFPNAKINLGLNIISKRKDGYHELETCFCPIPWQESLEIVEADKTIMTVSGINIPDDGENIVLKAYNLLKSSFKLPPVHIHLHKSIPIGAGLGGGSADAAFTLSLLNKLFSIGITDEELMKFALTLGADCPFFIKNKPMLAAGIGEMLSEVSLPLADKFVIMVYPGIHISTKEAYSGVVPQKPIMEIKQILKEKSIYEWKAVLVNDFELTLFKTYPILERIKQQLYEMGAFYASMSGSGSCIYGIFEESQQIKFADSYKIWSGRIEFS